MAIGPTSQIPYTEGTSTGCWRREARGMFGRMLAEFIATYRDLIVARTREKVAARVSPRATEVELIHGIPLFLDQLTARLTTNDAGAGEYAASASLHGGELLKNGLTVAQVVHDYGNVCQAITEVAVERDAQVPIEDFRRLNLVLDTAIAEAVTEYIRRRDEIVHGQHVESLGFLAHELRNLLSTASLAFEAIRSGDAPTGGATGALLVKNLDAMRDLVDRSLSEVRLEAAAPNRERVVLAHLLEEIEIAATMQSKCNAIQISIVPVAIDVTVRADSQILASIVINLIQNACKFTPVHGHVSVATRVSDKLVCIDVSDECGGLPTDKVHELFRAFEQRGDDRSGLGLGLAICLKGARAMGGDVSVLNRPGTGCVFTVSVPRFAEA